MDWIQISPQVHNTFGSLGYVKGDTYFINDNCLVILTEILKKLTGEDRILRTFRRAVGFGQNVKKDLVPILIHVKDNPKVIDMTIKILVNLTIPVECLLSIDDMSRNNVGRHTIYELNNLLLASKEAFTDTRVTKVVLKYIQQICLKDCKLPVAHVEHINNGLLLLRNILHVPVYHNRVGNPATHGSSQNKILWNLFTQSIDKIILNLIGSNHGANWSVTMVQLIALIYKDQHVGTLQKLLNIWFESSLTESSDESNTSPPEQGSDDSSAMVSSDPTSESSDGGNNESRADGTNKDIHFHQPNFSKAKRSSGSAFGLVHQPQTQNASHSSRAPDVEMKILPDDVKNPPQNSNTNVVLSTGCKRGPPTPLSQMINASGPKKECTSAISEYSDYGYVTQLENQESISTSSNEDYAPEKKPPHQKPPGNKHKHNKERPPVTADEKKAIRRKKLVKRGKTNIIHMKGLVHHTATDDDITNVLKEFTVDFLLKGYGSLVHSLYTQLLCDLHLQIDTSHFFWLVTYFLKFAAQLELDFEHVNKILSFEIISYLTYEGVHLCEQVQLLSRTQSSELKPSLRRMHLVITAIREFIQTVDAYGKITHLSDDDRSQMNKLQARICATEELRNLFILLIRHFQPEVHSKQYLQDLIVTNHVLLLFIDSGTKQPDIPNINMVEHLRQFTTVEVMHQYGLLLAEFRSNGEYVNDCIFTMMHHVGGDLNTLSSLFQPNILKIFSLIWETDFEICDDWSDLVDYTINQFIKAPRPLVLPSAIPKVDICLVESIDEPTNISWTREERDKLNWFYMQSKKHSNVIQSISALLQDDGVNKSDEAIVDQLYEQEVITREEFLKLQKNAESICMEACPLALVKSIFIKDDVENLKDNLIKQNMKSALTWLQKELLEVCYAKLCLQNKTKEENFRIHDYIIDLIEPIAFHNSLMNQSIPIIPWNNEQSTAIHNQTFLHLLHRLGFHLPEDSGKLFVRIPNFWTIDVLVHIANRLGPIDPATLKFKLEDISTLGHSEGKECMEVSVTLVKESSNEITKSSILDSMFGHDSSFRIHRTKQIHSLIQFTPLPSSRLPMEEAKCENGQANWLNLVMKTKTSCCEQEKKSTQKRHYSSPVQFYQSYEEEKLAKREKLFKFSENIESKNIL